MLLIHEAKLQFEQLFAFRTEHSVQFQTQEVDSLEGMIQL